MKCCVLTDVGTWTNWLTFEPDPDYSPDDGTVLLSPISYALQRGILLRRENSTPPVDAATRGFKTVLLTASRGYIFVGGTCPSSCECRYRYKVRPKYTYLLQRRYAIGVVCLYVLPGNKS